MIKSAVAQGLQERFDWTCCIAMAELSILVVGCRDLVDVRQSAHGSISLSES